MGYGAYSMPVEGGGGSPSLIDSLASIGSDAYDLVSSVASTAGASLSQIASEASSWSQAKTDDTYHAFAELIERRKRIWLAIQRMPEGGQKEALKAEFSGIESYVESALFPLANKFYSLAGYSPIDTNLGALPILGLAAIAAALSLGIVWVLKHYAALEKNPALADSGISGGIGKGIQGMLWIAGLVVGVSVLMPMLQAKMAKR